MTDAVARALDSLGRLSEPLLDELRQLVRIPSVSGTDAENEAQAHLAGVLGAAGLDVDHWPIDLDELAADPDFPGMEVDRTRGVGPRRPAARAAATAPR